MPNETLQQIYEGADLSAEKLGLMYFRLERDCRIIGLAIFSDEDVSADSLFNLNKNGAAQFSGGARPKILNGDDKIEIAALSIDGLRGDKMVVDFLSGAVPTPVVLLLDITDPPPPTFFGDLFNTLDTDKWDDVTFAGGNMNVAAGVLTLATGGSYSSGEAWAQRTTHDGVDLTSHFIETFIAEYNLAGSNQMRIYIFANDGSGGYAYFLMNEGSGVGIGRVYADGATQTVSATGGANHPTKIRFSHDGTNLVLQTWNGSSYDTIFSWACTWDLSAVKIMIWVYTYTSNNSNVKFEKVESDIPV